MQYTNLLAVISYGAQQAVVKISHNYSAHDSIRNISLMTPNNKYVDSNGISSIVL